MSHTVCCVANCKSTGKNSKCSFFSFPKIGYKKHQKDQWIAAVRRINGKNWSPRSHDTICSNHFIGNCKSQEELSPNYIPTLFSFESMKKVDNHQSMIRRHERFVKRRSAHRKELNIHIRKNKSVENNTVETAINEVFIVEELKYADKECQVYTAEESTGTERTFFIAKFMHSNNTCDAEIQVDIFTNPGFITIINRKKMIDKQCSTPQEKYKDQSVGSYSDSTVCNMNDGFKGYYSLKKEEELNDLAGISFSHFEFLLERISVNEDNSKVKKHNRLLIFLMKIKTGMTFSALSAIFGVHRTTVSRIFFNILQELSSATSDLVYWPNQDIVRGTMPKCFNPDYSDTRVIIDCTEFRIEVPATVDNRVYCYSHYKKGFTAKVLIGITPAGFISFKSLVAGGRKSDSQITVESGLIDLLEDGDKVLADKGFPEIKTMLDNKGKNIFLVMPPFLRDKHEFSKEETQATYSIARVRIHVERIMQRLRVYQILNKIPENLFYHIDDIVHMCCVLVNLQPPIFSDCNMRN